MHDHRIAVSNKDLESRKLAIYALFLKKIPPIQMIRDEEAREDSGLQDFICDNLKDEFCYATGLSVMDAVDAIVISQIENGDEKLV